MKSDISKKDLRIIKTHIALRRALFDLLESKNFNSITVNDLCSQALISRATFYVHFDDKYDFLRSFLLDIKRKIIKDINNFEELEREINHFVNTNKKMITNVITEANSETLSLIRDFMSSIVELTVKRNYQDIKSANHIVLFNFFIGGLTNLLTWLVENNFPPEVQMMDNYLYRMLEHIAIWDSKQE